MHTHTHISRILFPAQPMQENTEKFYFIFSHFLYPMYYIPTFYNGISEETQLNRLNNHSKPLIKGGDGNSLHLC